MLRPELLQVVNASLTPDGNLSVIVDPPIEYGTEYDVSYRRHPVAESRYSRWIGDVFHNAVDSFQQYSGVNLIMPILELSGRMSRKGSQ